ncbi:MAG: OmpA family protein [Bacteroidales bacterium]
MNAWWRFLCILLIGGNLLSFPVSAQSELTPNLRRAMLSFEHARNFYQEGDSKRAFLFVNTALEIEPLYAEAWLLKAVILEDQHLIDSAIFCYRQSLDINPDVFPNAYFTIAKLEHSIGLYAQADQDFTSFLNHPSHSKKLEATAIARKLQNKDSWELSKNIVPFQPVNLGDSINTPEEEYLPIVTVDGSKLIITRRYTPDKMETAPLEEDFFISHKDSSARWTKAQRMPEPVNSDGNEGAQCLSPDGRYLFFAACNREDGIGSCDIYVSKRKGEQWEKPFNLGRTVNTEFWESQPSMAGDGKTLYFCSNRPGGFGRSDIWKTVLQNNATWSEPENLGSPINTPSDENSPFIHPDGKTLYFSSNGHPGLGGLDLFYSRLQADNQWSSPVNLGYPINTYADEATLSVNALGDTAYFSSDQLGGKGKRDIYCFRLYEQARPKLVSYMSGTVVDAVTNQPLGAKLELINLSDEKVSIESFADDKNGSFLLCIPSNEAYALNVSYPSYLFFSEHIAITDSQAIEPQHKVIRLSKIISGEKMTLKNIFFETDKYQLKDASFAELNKLYQLLKQNADITVEISGHTDSTGSSSYNLLLSKQRADAVSSYLQNKGISTKRIITIGYGDTHPLADNGNEEGRSKNRRTEIKIL